MQQHTTFSALCFARRPIFAFVPFVEPYFLIVRPFFSSSFVNFRKTFLKNFPANVSLGLPILGRHNDSQGLPDDEEFSEQ